MSGNDNRHDIIGMIEEIIRDQVQFLKHYVANVFDNEDPQKKGRVLVGIPELNMVTASNGVWAYPRDKNSMSIPKIDSYVEVYFMNGNRNRAVYLGIASEMIDMGLINFDGLPSTHVLFESPKETVNRIIYDEIEKILSVAMEKITLCEGAESFVLGNTLKTELQKTLDAVAQLQTDMSSWTPAPNDGGLALKTLVTSGFLTKPSASLTDVLSEKIKGA